MVHVVFLSQWIKVIDLDQFLIYLCVMVIDNQRSSVFSHDDIVIAQLFLKKEKKKEK